MTEKRHWIYIGSSHWPDGDPRQEDQPTWHWSPDADSYGEEGRALCGRVFPGSPYVSADPPAADQHVCPRCEEAIKKVWQEAANKIDLAANFMEVVKYQQTYDFMFGKPTVRPDR